MMARRHRLPSAMAPAGAAPAAALRRPLGAACWLAAALLPSLAWAADPRPAAEKAEAARSKAEALEAKASAEGDGKAPTAAQSITGSEARAVDPQGREPLDDALTCLARSIYWEAKGEDRPGMEAIANVVMNRLGREGFPSTVCGVVKEGNESGACQFSWWCDGLPDAVEEESRHAIAIEIARLALNRQLPDRTDGALYFQSGDATPAWLDDYIETAGLGEHRFYKPKDGAAK
jgi:spore germination cell wall hydrolase CwlJ-like protein